MKLKEIMTREVEVIHPNDSLQTAAQKMRDRDVGFLLVYEGNELIGVLTDRDLVVRAIADGLNAKGILGRDIMTSPLIQCFDDQTAEEAAELMHQNRVRRLVILDHGNNQVVGVVSMGDLAGTLDDKTSGKVLQGVSPQVKSHS
jgi:CBS domain-containing protein